MATRKVEFIFDPFRNTGRPKKNVASAKDAVKDFVRASVVEMAQASTSPVDGGKWRVPLTKPYAKIKGSDQADLTLSEAMLDDMTVVNSGSKLKIKFTSTTQNAKADGNNRGTYGRKSPISGGKFKREFIPKKGQTWNDSIWDGIDSIVEDFIDDDED